MQQGWDVLLERGEKPRGAVPAPGPCPSLDIQQQVPDLVPAASGYRLGLPAQ